MANKMYDALLQSNINLLEVRHPNTNEIIDILSVDSNDVSGGFLQVKGIDFTDFVTSNVQSGSLPAKIIAHIQSSSIVTRKYSINYLFAFFYAGY
jgi:hypothetical protein